MSTCSCAVCVTIFNNSNWFRIYGLSYMLPVLMRSWYTIYEACILYMKRVYYIWSVYTTIWSDTAMSVCAKHAWCTTWCVGYHIWYTAWLVANHINEIMLSLTPPNCKWWKAGWDLGMRLICLHLLPYQQNLTPHFSKPLEGVISCVIYVQRI